MNNLSPISALTASNASQTFAAPSTNAATNEPQESFLDVLRGQSGRGNDLSDDPEVKEKFTEFFGKTLFGQALSSMRKTQEKPAYFHVGRAEEVFQQELDRTLVEHITEAAGEKFTDPMFELFALNRR